MQAKSTQDSFTAEELYTTDVATPRGNIIFSAGDPSSVVEDLPPTIETDVIPALLESTAAPKSIRFVAARIRKQTDEWRNVFTLLSASEIHHQPKLLTHAWHGSVTILQADIPLDMTSSAATARATIRKINNAQSLGRHKLTCLHHCP
jgi:hypothetical protein